MEAELGIPLEGSTLCTWRDIDTSVHPAWGVPFQGFQQSTKILYSLSNLETLIHN